MDVSKCQPIGNPFTDYIDTIGMWGIGILVFNEETGEEEIEFYLDTFEHQGPARDREEIVPSDRPVFASQRDCQLAIDNLARHGYSTTEDLDNINSRKMVRLAYEALPW